MDIISSNSFALLETESESPAPAVPAEKEAQPERKQPKKAVEKEGGEVRRRERQPDRRGPSNKRIYDRKSGTGRQASEMKKGGAGRHNWGTEGSRDEEWVKKEVAEKAKEEVVPEKKNGEDAKEGEEKSTEAPVVEEEKPVVELSLDEYMAGLAEKKVVLDKKAERKAGEGEDDSRWKQSTKFERVDKPDEKLAGFFGDNRGEVKYRNRKAKKEKNVTAELTNFRFAEDNAPPPRRERRDGGERRQGGGEREQRRGGRGGGSYSPRRGGRGGAAPGGGRSAPRVAEGKAEVLANGNFPSLI